MLPAAGECFRQVLQFSESKCVCVCAAACPRACKCARVWCVGVWGVKWQQKKRRPDSLVDIVDVLDLKSRSIRSDATQVLPLAWHFISV